MEYWEWEYYDEEDQMYIDMWKPYKIWESASNICNDCEHENKLHLHSLLSNSPLRVQTKYGRD